MSEPTEKAPRGPTNLRIKFRSASLDQFIERYAVDVSRGGIFIRTREPLAVGTRLKLEFQLQDAAPLLAGEGTVVWIREPDPMRENVTPGMGVRFDKLSPESQPTLEKILAEKTRLQQSGVPPNPLSKSSAGMAVRRSGVFPIADSAGVPKPAPTGTPAAAAAPPVAPVAPTPSEQASAAPPSPAPRPASPFASTTSKTSFMGSGTATPGASAPPAAAGGPFRARTTTGSGVRSAPVPSALFEPPTADDIDKALEALQETSGAHLPPPMSMQATQPAIEAPRMVADDASNEPTRVADVVDELVGGSGGHRSAAADEPDPDAPELEEAETSDASLQEHPSTAAGSAASLDVPIELEEVEPARPLPPEPRARKPDADAKSSGAPLPIASEKSTRFRAASSAYPTLKRRQLTFLGVGVIVVGAVLIVGVLKLKWKERLFPAPPPTPAAVAEAPPPPAPAAANPPPPATVPGAPEGAGGGAAEATPKAEIAPPAAPPPKAEAPAAEKPAAEIANKPAAAEHAPAGDHAPAKRGPIRHPAHSASEAAVDTKAPAAGATPAAEPSGASAGAAAASPPPAIGNKAGGEKPADKATEKSVADKAAPDKTAATAPAEAAPPTPPPPVLKITSTPTGAEVVIDGMSVGSTPFTSKGIDPAAPHAISVKKDGYEPAERMIGGLDWSRPRGNTPPSLKVNLKLRRSAPAPAAAAPKENAQPADDPGGPYIKEIKPDSP